jgi:chorismate mutase / prephenate dehydratase
MSTFSLILSGGTPTSTPPDAANEAMFSTPSDLQGLRRRLDEIDDRLQDLLMDRAAIVAQVAGTKKDDNQPALQPAREAQIVRRLVDRHRGAFPIAYLVRMWREMLAATVAMQSPLSVVVFAPADQQGYWDLARDHYGSNTPMTALDSVDQVIRAVRCRDSTVGLLPLPQPGEPEPWWPYLVSAAEERPQVIARLPFGSPGNARTSGAEALAIGWGMQQESGFDRTLFAAGCVADVGCARILELLSTLRLTCTLLASCNRGLPIHLIEVDGFVPISDARLDAFRSELGAGLYQLLPIGGYAVPLLAQILHPRG